MSQMKSLGSGIRLTASASIFQIPIQLTFIEASYMAVSTQGVCVQCSASPLQREEILDVRAIWL